MNLTGIKSDGLYSSERLFHSLVAETTRGLKRTCTIPHAVTNKGERHCSALRSPQRAGRLASPHFTQTGRWESGPGNYYLLLFFYSAIIASLKIVFAFSIFFIYVT